MGKLSVGELHGEVGFELRLPRPVLSALKHSSESQQRVQAPIISFVIFFKAVLKEPHNVNKF